MKLFFAYFAIVVAVQGRIQRTTTTTREKRSTHPTPTNYRLVGKDAAAAATTRRKLNVVVPQTEEEPYLKDAAYVVDSEYQIEDVPDVYYEEYGDDNDEGYGVIIKDEKEEEQYLNFILKKQMEFDEKNTQEEEEDLEQEKGFMEDSSINLDYELVYDDEEEELEEVYEEEEEEEEYEEYEDDEDEYEEEEFGLDKMKTTTTTTTTVVDGCHDQHPKCKDWAAIGECHESLDYMIQYCPKACGACSE
eukprot:CAMPEP_0178923568 /NCGR_PEP_ID=MMETSP0786-20121207/16801_1 /TAXON_ID=186022 /ORGANISM="Thalassionema frauenfeldii, Strain CCMP 1798" /LENGTH=246 /DNA_ID=CAMNT_0020598097 /DNA_START=338 /DNA_END=1078 /DNA_ORIENTATION=-